MKKVYVSLFSLTVILISGLWIFGIDSNTPPGFNEKRVVSQSMDQDVKQKLNDSSFSVNIIADTEPRETSISYLTPPKSLLEKKNNHIPLTKEEKSNLQVQRDESKGEIDKLISEFDQNLFDVEKRTEIEQVMEKHSAKYKKAVLALAKNELNKNEN